MGSCTRCIKLFNNSTFSLDNVSKVHKINTFHPLSSPPSLVHSDLENELRGTHLKIGTLQNGVLSNAYRRNGTWYGGGVAFQIIELLQKKYKFQYSVVLPSQNQIGSRDEGLFGLIYNENVDLGAAFLPMTTPFTEYTNFSATLDCGDWVAVFKRPEELESSGYGLLAPFTTNVWISIIFCLILVGCTLFLILSSFKKLYKKCNCNSLTECLWFVYGALLKQSSTLEPKTDSSRIVCATWWIFVTLMTAFYTANFTAYLTVSELPLHIKAISDIASHKHPLIIKAGSVIETLIKNSSDKLNVIYKTSNKIFINGDDESILSNWISNKPRHVYIAEQPNIDIDLYRNYLKQMKCSYIALGCIYTSPRAFTYSKSFKFGMLFDKTLRNLMETGLIQRYIKTYLPRGNSCPVKLRSRELQLNNSHLSMAYYLMMAGFLLAFVMFIIEIGTRILKRRSNKDVKRETDPNLPAPIFMNVLLPRLDYFSSVKKKTINGRCYWVINFNGELRLIPIRAASTLAFYKRSVIH